MKLRLLSLLTLLLVSTVSAQNNQGGTLVTAPIRPFAVQDTFPTAIANEIKGGPFTAANLASLANIPSSRLEIGSLGYAQDTGLFYRLTSLSPVTWSPLDGSNFINLPTSSTNVSGTLSISSGGTGATNVSGARVNLGLSSSDNVNFNTLLVSSGSSSANAIQLGTNDIGLYRTTSPDILYINNKGNMLAIGTNGPITATAFSATTLNIGAGGSITFNDAGPTRTNLGLGVTNSMTFLSVTASNSSTTNKSTLDETGISGWNKEVSLEQGGLLDGGSLALSWSTNQITAFAPINFFTPEIAESTRVNLGFNSATSVSFSNLTVTGGSLTNLGISIGAATRGFFSISDPERLTAVSGGIAVMSMFPNSIELGSNIPLQFSGTGAAITRTNLGLGAAWLTNNNVTNFRSDIGLGTSSGVTFRDIVFSNSIQGPVYAFGATTLAARGGTNGRIQFTLLANIVISELDQYGTFHSPGIQMTGSDGAISFASTNSTGAGITRTNLGLGNSSDVTFSKMHLGFAQQFGSTTYTLTLGQTNSGFIKDSAAGTGTGTDEWSFHSSGSRVWGARWRYIGNTTNTERYFEAPNSVLQKIEARDINLNITYDSPGGTEPFINFNTGQFAETNKTISFKGTSYFNGSISGQPIYTPRILLQNGNSNIASISRDEFNFSVPISFETTNNAAATLTNLGLGESNIPAFNGVSLRSPVGRWDITSKTNQQLGFSRAGGGEPVVFHSDGIELQNVVTGASYLRFSSNNTVGAATTRTNLGLGATWLTNTNVVNFRTDIGLVGSGFASFNSGSSGNDASGEYASTVGGALNTASGNYSFAAGRNAKATNQGAFVWADSQTGNFSSSSSNTFNIRASGGMSLDLGTNGISFRNPEAAAATRTNLGLGAGSTNIVGFGDVKMSSFGINFIEPVDQQTVLGLPSDTDPVYLNPVHWNNSGVRTALGLGAAWLTNTNPPLAWSSVPASTNSTGLAGQIAYTNNFLYICISNNTWRRVQLGTW